MWNNPPHRSPSPPPPPPPSSSSYSLFQGSPCPYHANRGVLCQGHNQFPSYRNQTLEEAFSQLSMNNTAPLEFGLDFSDDFDAEGSKFSSFDDPFVPNHSHYVGLQELRRGSSINGFPKQGWFMANDIASSSSYGIVPAPSSSPSPSPRSPYLSRYQRELLQSHLQNNEFRGGSRGRRSYACGVNGVMSNSYLRNNRMNDNNNFSGLNLNASRRSQFQYRRNQPLLQKDQSLSVASVYELKGRVMELAKDPCRCSIVKDTMEGLKTQEEVSFVFEELVSGVVELMVDPFGNDVFRKLVEICSEEQRTAMIKMVARNVLHLVTICCDNYGTRSVQRLLEHVTNQEQRSLIMSALTPSTVALSTDMNGLHVVKHCVKYFSIEDNKYMLKIVASNCLEISTNKSGCCVMNHCVDYAEGEIKEQLMTEIIVNASFLVGDFYGNYVVQHLVSMRISRVTKSLLRKLEGTFVLISCNKYGSNVVEKFFQESGEEDSNSIILELLSHPNVSTLLVDPYGNYVISSAFKVSKGIILKTLLELVQLHLPTMHTNLYGQKLLERLRNMPHVTMFYL